MYDDTFDQVQEKHAEQLGRQPWEPAGVISHQSKKDHNKKTQTSDKGGISNLDVEYFRTKMMMDK